MSPLRFAVLATLGWLGAGCRPILGIEETRIDPHGCALLTQPGFFADKPV
jgi:hypothetical protein